MNQDEWYQQHYNVVWDATIKSVIIHNADSRFDNIPSEEEIRQSHSFSPEFLQNMETILHKNQAPKRKLRHPVRIKTEQSIEEPDQSFWEEWKHQHPTTDGFSADGSTPAAAEPGITAPHRAHLTGRPTFWHCSHRLRRSAKAVIAAAIVLVIVIGGIHLSDNGFLRASRTQNVVEYGGQSTLLTNMSEQDYELIFRKPGFIPKTYKLISDHKYDYMRTLEYSDGVKTLTIRYTLCKEDADAQIDNERHPQEEKSILLKHKYDAVLSVPKLPDAYTVFSWKDGLIQYIILSHESKETLLQIAESMVP